MTSIGPYKIMRKLALLLFLFMPLVAVCKKRRHHYHKIIPPSRWKEVKRMKLIDSTYLTYQDTIHIEFLLHNKYIWHRTKGFIYKSSYTLSENELNLGMFNLTIVERRPNKLILRDDSTVFFFASDIQAPSLADKKIENGEVVVPPKPVNSIDQMIGHWSEYKRTPDKPLNSVDYARIVKIIDVTGGSTDSSLGYLYAANDPVNAPSWKIMSFDNHQLICDGKDKRTLTVIKCQDNELVVQEGEITYYFKQFK